MSFRLTSDEFSAVVEASKKSNPRRSPQDWCRALVLLAAKRRAPDPPPLRARPKRKPSADVEALARILASLGKIGSNANQIARVANSLNRLPRIPALDSLAEDIRQARDDIRRALERTNGD
ncbi:MAG: hypothetical protein HQL42_10930 [Alphaproteobacteria bacterium]|nr:hypothetical protein [Alphaproteobacteria bacterium]